MAIVDLGTQTFEAVRIASFYAPLTLAEAENNLLLVTITRDFIVDPVSYFELIAKYSVPLQPAFVSVVLAEFDILESNYGLVPNISLPLPSNTIVEYGLTRYPIFRGGADGQSIDIQLQVNIPTATNLPELE